MQVKRNSLEGEVYERFAVLGDKLTAGASSGMLIVSA